jgi:hypothetical protein
VASSVSNPVYTDTGIPVFGTPNTDTGKNLPIFAGYLPLLLFRGICSTMKSWSIFHVYSTVTSTDVRYWILALPMRDIRATDIDLL